MIFVKEFRKTKTDFLSIGALNNTIIDRLKIGILTLDKNNRILLSNKHSVTLLAHFNDTESLIRDLIIAGTSEPHRLHIDDDTYLAVNFIPTIKGAFLTIRDISKDVKQEKYAEENRKLRLLSHISSILAHEIKNPISSLSGSVELLKGGTGITEEQKKKLFKIIENDSTRLLNLVEEFLVYSSPDKRFNEKFSLTTLLSSCMDSLSIRKEFKEKGLNIVAKIPENEEGDIFFKGDFQRMCQAVDNLLINAMHASNINDDITLTLKATDNNVTITISDCGSGISDEIKQKVFEPFYSTKKRGTGLGLAIVNNIISAHGGKITIQDADPGARFILDFTMEQQRGI